MDLLASSGIQTSDRTTLGDADHLYKIASEIRDRGKGHVVSFSPKVFLPLTRLCRDFCGYCTFRQTPQRAEQIYMTPDEVLAVARRGERQGCHEALFVLGDRPEHRYSEARKWLRDRGYDSTVEYLHKMCSLVLQETSLYPHSNAGILTRAEMESLKEVNASMGLMLESVSPRLCDAGGPHEHASSKDPKVRIEMLRVAGELRIVLTTGLLIGIGETVNERIEALEAIKRLSQEHGHIQEVIIQNFRRKPQTTMGKAPEPTVQEISQTAAYARVVLGEKMNIQVPPNLTPVDLHDSLRCYLNAGINDLGGISPTTIDHVNPEAPWPEIERLKKETDSAGYELRSRFPVYPEYILARSSYLNESLRNRLLAKADKQGYIRCVAEVRND